MNAKKRIFKEKLDAVLIPGTTPKDEWSVLLQPIWVVFQTVCLG